MNLIENRHRGSTKAPPKGAAAAQLLARAVKACNARQDTAVTLLTESAVTPFKWEVSRL